ncbi:hypothetical protein [Undibacterium umbellatum]|uniref:Uncharacterized protein n=1 Tax=Undibacterium umbellatum TaxID=2762300 RepID=A0ABR6ZHL6_9BURK|nr:hypothetical protein [Undibacterium umbellatum]MBC3911209.1 hypothetical protein [Undibacterium umbellatum]
MGGNALKAESVRLPAARYREVEHEAVAILQRNFPQRRIEAIIAYADKADFGDLDILIEAGDDYDAAQFSTALQATEIVLNGDVTSIGLAVAEGVFQLDLIRTESGSFDFASRYFGYNDFGNLIGRIAHKFGAKFGHLGLLYPLRAPDDKGHLIAELCITTDFSEALKLLGYDALLYENMRVNGQFRNLQDIFRYVVSSPYVNREIYLLDNRNHKARIRDAKRTTYNAFLLWLDEQKEITLPAYPWAEAGTAARDAQKENFLETTFMLFPDFRLAYVQALQKYARKKRLKQQFNGELAAEITGLSGKRLGELMAQVRHSFADEASFENFFLEADSDAVKARFLKEAAVLTSS